MPDHHRHRVVVLFYQYFLPPKAKPLRDHADYYTDCLYNHQQDLCQRLKLRGRVLISSEGINGTVSAENESVLLEYKESMEGFCLSSCGLPEGYQQEVGSITNEELSKHFLYRDMDWKQSSVDDPLKEPFPDLKISLVSEIVSTGGAVRVDEIPKYGGKHLTPKEFHETLRNNKDVVLIDVRNTFECSIGHFVNPYTKQAAWNPETVTFSSFDKTFCERHAPALRDRKVLMYCTGGIRCEKASAMLRKRGVDDVSQLQGGIHRYVEEFGDQGFFRGKNFVFDQRVALETSPTRRATGEDKCRSETDIVGKCIECRAPFDEISGSRLCTVCRDLVLVCPTCQQKLREYHCQRHSGWKECFFTFLEVFSQEELEKQLEQLVSICEGVEPNNNKNKRNMRKTLQRQLLRVRERLNSLSAGRAQPDSNAPRRCRTCMESQEVCDGHCWGFWKHSTGDKRKHGEIIQRIQPGDRVEPGPDWNTLRLGSKTTPSGELKQGRVVDIKSWGTGSDENDCVVVVWDDQGTATSKKLSRGLIYRWGFVARNGQRMYDVRAVSQVAQKTVKSPNK